MKEGLELEVGGWRLGGVGGRVRGWCKSRVRVGA